MPYLLGAAFVLVLVAMSRRSDAAPSADARSLPEGVDSNDYVHKALEEEAGKHVDAPPNPDAEVQAWIDFYKQKKAESEVGAPLPAEVPERSADFGATGDIDKLPLAMKQEVLASLFEQDDPETLFVLADEVENAGFLIAANRLRQKAFRMMAT